MNKILPFLIALMPTVCLGLSDACTEPSNFTIDKRCYVTPEQKKTFPYETVVALIEDGYVYCTGTIISESDGKKRVYTAKHCTDVNEDNVVDKTITIKTQGGDTYDVTNTGIKPTDAYGNYNIAEDTLFSGDWAKYDLPSNAPDDLPSTTFTKRHSGTLGLYEAIKEKSSVPEKRFWTIFNYDAQVVGYGALKIMSDDEIKDFKDEYIEFLVAAVKKKYKDSGVSPDNMKKIIDYYITHEIYTGFDGEGVNAAHPMVKEFIGTMSRNDYNYKALFKDNNLKTSFCQLNVKGYKQGCQSWGGNSGGPIFDKDGKLMGIHTRGYRIIGGKRHAGRDYNNPKNNDGGWSEVPDGHPDSNIHFLK